MLRARETLTARFTDFFTDFEKKNDCFAVYELRYRLIYYDWPSPVKSCPRNKQLHSSMGAIHSTKISGNFGPKLSGSVRSDRKSFEKTGPPFEVDFFSRSDLLEFWLNGSRP